MQGRTGISQPPLPPSLLFQPIHIPVAPPCPHNPEPFHPLDVKSRPDGDDSFPSGWWLPYRIPEFHCVFSAQHKSGSVCVGGGGGRRKADHRNTPTHSTPSHKPPPWADGSTGSALMHGGA